MAEKVISISSKNTDYFQWGKNCKILGFSLEETSDISAVAIAEEKVSNDDVDLFWYGYHYGVGNK